MEAKRPAVDLETPPVKRIKLEEEKLKDEELEVEKLEVEQLEDSNMEDGEPFVNARVVPPIYIDPNGDLILHVGKNNAVFVVDASAMCRSSPVFNDSLESDGSVLDAGSVRALSLADADPAAAEVILNIVHARFGKIPQRPDLALLYNITLLADQCDMTDVLQPWAQGWAAIIDSHDALESLTNELRGPSIEDLQRISCLFHLRQLPEFVKWFVPIIAKTDKSDTGHLMYSASESVAGQRQLLWRHALSHNNATLALTSHACPFREDALQYILDALEEMTLYLQDPDEAHLSKRCARQCLGIIHQHLNRANLYPLPKVREIRISPARLFALILSIISDIASDFQTGCRCCKTHVVDGVPKAVHTQCVFPQENIPLLNDYLSESLSTYVRDKLRQVFKVVAWKLELRRRMR